jgi:hypothetical protein
MKTARRNVKIPFRFAALSLGERGMLAGPPGS